MVSPARRARQTHARKHTRPAKTRNAPIRTAKSNKAFLRPAKTRVAITRPAKPHSLKRRGSHQKSRSRDSYRDRHHYTYQDLPLRYRIRTPTLIISIIAAATILLAIVALVVWYAAETADAQTSLPKDLSGASKQPETQTSPKEYVIETTNDSADEDATTKDATTKDATTNDASTGEGILGADTDASSLTGSVIDINQAEDVARLFARGFSAFDAAAMYPYLHSRLTDTYTPEQLAQAILYFKPKDKFHARFDGVVGGSDASVATPSGYAARIEVGTDTTGWQTLEFPLAIEDGGWKVVWMDNLTTKEGIIKTCTSRINDDAEHAFVIDARKASASSCIADIAVILRDSSLCAYSFYDRGRCLRALNTNLPAQELIDGCNATSPDSTTFSKCIYDAAVETDNYDICRAIATNRAERYSCLGAIGGKHDNPAVCNEGFNIFTKNLCVQSYIAIENDVAGVCAVPELVHFLQNCPG
jgi:hypothetical protein